MELNSNSNIDPNIDFQKTVDEAKNAIQNEGQKKVRKGRSDKGRIRKTENSGPTPQPSPFGPNSSTTNAPNGIQPASIDLSPYIAVPLEIISRGPARKHKIPELALTPQEALDCAKALNEVFNVFVPNINQMSPKAAAIVGASMVIGSVALSKYQVYSETMAYRQSQLSEAPPLNKDPMPEPEIPLPQGSIPADKFFRR